ncbi:MAG: carbamoyltransferase [bacterium]
MWILGISAFYHDSAAALVRDDEIVAAAQEERFTRKKHDHSFPTHAVQACLDIAGISINQVDYVVFYDKPILKFDRLLETYFGSVPKGIRSFLAAMPLWLKEKLWMTDTIGKTLGYEGEILFAEHHESHAASAFYPSPFDRAAILTIDGVGEWATTTCGHGRGKELEILAETRFPHSLGLLYSAFTYYTGFKVNSGEYKVMGLAPYGRPIYVQTILDNLLDLKEDGSFKINLDYFNYHSGLTMTNGAFDNLFGGPPRKPESLLTQREMDLARSVQDVTEEAMLRMARHVHGLTGEDDLCMAGGVALNCVGNGRILREGPFKRIWIQPAAGDAGGALGAALAVAYRYLNVERATPKSSSETRTTDRMRAALLGPEYSDAEIERQLTRVGAKLNPVPISEIPERTADLLLQERVVGWFQGRMEFGPRALGARSILGDARSTEMQETMNLKIKFRESFRPFAPVVLEERVSEYFELDRESPYMLLVAPVQPKRRIAMTDEQEDLFGLDKLHVPRSDIPAVTHVDYSARVQTIAHDDHPLYYDTIAAFERKTGCAVIVNTSFNVRGEPIVCTPEDAYRCFMRTNMDNLVIGGFVLHKEEQPEWHETEDWRKEFTLD